MITAITLENFKGIRERVRLELKPLTLLFGPNSGGKSTILQAIHYADEVLRRRNFDAGPTQASGSIIDLKGFRSFVHNRDQRLPVCLRFELDLRGRGISALGDTDGDERLEVGVPRVCRNVASASIEFCVQWSARGLFVRRYAVEIDGEPIAEIQYNESVGQSQIVAVNFDHPAFAAMGLSRDKEDRLEQFTWADFSRPDSWLRLAGDQRDALPNFERELDVTGYLGGTPESPDDSFDCSSLRYIFSSLLLGPGARLAEELQQFRYIGPLREIPPAGFTPLRFPDRGRWATGLGAWDVLHSCEPELIEEVSDWLSNPARLGTGYQLRVKHVKELDSQSPLWTEMLSGMAARNPDERQRLMLALPTKREVGLATEQGVGDVHPSEVGVGVSQVLPVIVASLDNYRGLICIEQPELHLHPRVQCELGDLLIAGTLGQRSGPRNNDPIRKTFIVETHSEHLILRILRRIRETSRGTPHDGVPVTPEDVSVVYVSQEDGQSVPRTIHIDKNGEFVELWPDKFFELDFYEKLG